jgi:hypothetical protein
MSDESIAIGKLRRIEELWEQLKAAKTNTAGYEALIKDIRALSLEYQKLVVAVKKPN